MRPECDWLMVPDGGLPLQFQTTVFLISFYVIINEDDDMTAYMIVDVDVNDPEGYAKYKTEVPTLIAKHGGEYLVRGGDFEVLEGDWQPTRMVLFSFPNRQAIRDFVNDPAYAELKALRQKTASSSLVAVDGIE
jgi:uncharacterized protein (DUF1330 family)